MFLFEYSRLNLEEDTRPASAIGKFCDWILTTRHNRYGNSWALLKKDNDILFSVRVA
jgi:hypothetical protein